MTFRHLRASWDRFVSTLTLALIGFAGGVVTTYHQAFPYQMADEVATLADFLGDNWKVYLELEPTPWLRPATALGAGVTVHDEARAAPGLTFMTGLFDGEVALQLVAMDGRVVHRWPAAFTSLWPDLDHVRGYEVPLNDWLTSIHGAVLLPGGDVVFNFEFLGLVRLDPCGQVVWRLPYMTHHAVDLAEDGTFWVAGLRYHEQRSDRFPHLTPPFFEDTAIRVSQAGEILDEISVLGVLYANRVEGLFLLGGARDTVIRERDPLHLNDVEALPSRLAPAFPAFEAGDLLLSMRYLNLLMVVDPETRAVRWHQTGPWLRQHDPDFQPDGTISIFDNRGATGLDGRTLGGSRILAVNPTTGQVSERYVGRGDGRFFTSSRGKHQILPGGNIVITETLPGRVFEVDPSGRVVWSFVNRYDEQRVAQVQQGERVPLSILDGAPACPDRADQAPTAALIASP